MSSWKYAGAFASLKGTLIYSHFPNGEVKAVFGMDASSKGIWWYPAQKNVKVLLLHSATRPDGFSSTLQPYPWQGTHPTLM